MPIFPILLILFAVLTTLTTLGAGAQGFVHPGILHTRAEIDRARTRVDAGAQPWKGGWDRLAASSFAQIAYLPAPRREVCAGGNACPGGETFMPLARDCAAAYQNALRYRLSGDTHHADKAAAILDAWSDSLERFTGDSNAGLRAGLYGYQLAAAAELIRDYPGWAAADFARFKDMLLKVFYPVSSDFLRRHNGTCFDHYWANWDLANMATILAIAVLADDRAKFDEAVDYFKRGSGTGQVDRLVRQLYAGNPVLGQGQESGRDQGHATLCISLVGAFCKIAYDQGEDLFAYQDSKVLALAEYTAKYNLGDSVPWTEYTNCEGQKMTVVSPDGRGTVRPAWELLYNHYAIRKGLHAPDTRRFAEKVRPEGGGGQYGTNSGGFDQLGFGTLMFTEDGPAHVRAGNLLPAPRAVPYKGIFGNAFGLVREEGPTLEIFDVRGRAYTLFRRPPGRGGKDPENAVFSRISRPCPNLAQGLAEP